MSIHLPSVTPAKAGVHHDDAPPVQRLWRALDSGLRRNDTVLLAKGGETL
jgi:hypothetical protein